MVVLVQNSLTIASLGYFALLARAYFQLVSIPVGLDFCHVVIMSDQEGHPNGLGSSSEETKKEEQAAPAPRDPPALPAPPSYPPPLIFGINMFALYLAIFCVALDNTIISTAIPQITDEFHALDDVGWYGSGQWLPSRSAECEHRSANASPAAYSLTQCAFLLQFGKLYRLFSPKWTFLASLFVFEVGSLICAVAPTSLALIVGVSVLYCE